MPIELKMPQLGLTMTEGKVGKWLKKEGDRIVKDEPIVEIETDKVVSEVVSPSEGILDQILTPEGGKLPIGGVMAVIALNEEQVEKIKASPAAKKLADEHKIDLTQIRGSGPGSRIVEEDVQKAINSQAQTQRQIHQFQPKAEETRLKASPLAKRLAKEHNLDLTQIRGSGPQGRVIRDDILKAAEAKKLAQPAAQPAAPHVPKIEPTSPLIQRLTPLTGIRQIIADRTSQSIRTTARVTLIMEVDATNLVQMRSRLKDRFQSQDLSISYTDLLVKIVAHALKKHQVINSALMSDGIHIFESVNIGVAVALKDGLLVPVIKDADKKGLIEIHKDLKELAEKARGGKISLDEISGATFTITNLGTYGVEFFTPVINTPECAILGVGKVGLKPAVHNGQVCARDMMGLSLSFDHRITDGAPAAEFLQTISNLIQEPYMLMA